MMRLAPTKSQHKSRAAKRCGPESIGAQVPDLQEPAGAAEDLRAAVSCSRPRNLRRSHREKTDYQTLRGGAKYLQTKDLAADRYSAVMASAAASVDCSILLPLSRRRMPWELGS